MSTGQGYFCSWRSEEKTSSGIWECSEMKDHSDMTLQETYDGSSWNVEYDGYGLGKIDPPLDITGSDEGIFIAKEDRTTQIGFDGSGGTIEGIEAGVDIKIIDEDFDWTNISYGDDIRALSGFETYYARSCNINLGSAHGHLESYHEGIAAWFDTGVYVYGIAVLPRKGSFSLTNYTGSSGDVRWVGGWSAVHITAFVNFAKTDGSVDQWT